jgi:hypothetical protein
MIRSRWSAAAARAGTLALALAIALPVPAGAASATPPFDFGSQGGYAAIQLPPHTRDVELLAQRAGSCRFGRTWGFDPARLELWADQGCAGTFRAIVDPPPAPAQAGSAPAGTDPAAAVAAAAAIAGIAILAHKTRPDAQPVYPNGPYAPPGYHPSAARGGHIQGLGGLCLDIHGGEPVRAGSPAMVWQCAASGTQAFAWTRRGELRVAGLCLDIANGLDANGAAVIAWPCNGRGNQQWAFDRGTIRSRFNGRCLDVPNSRARPGTQVATWDCHGRANQLWRG